VVVLQLADRLHLPLKAGLGLRLARPLGGQQLDRDIARQSLVPRAKHDSHTPLADFLQQQVIANPLRLPLCNRQPRSLLYQRRKNFVDRFPGFRQRITQPVDQRVTFALEHFSGVVARGAFF
jgi:hypothetical protein